MLCNGGNGDIVMLVLMTSDIGGKLKFVLLYLFVYFVAVSVVLVGVLVVVTLVEVGW